MEVKGILLPVLSIKTKCTVNPLNNDIRYNSKIRCNVNSFCKKKQKNSGSCIFFIESPMLFFRKTYVLDISKNRLAKAILTNIHQSTAGAGGLGIRGKKEGEPE